MSILKQAQKNKSPRRKSERPGKLKQNLWIRPAASEDCKAVWEWSNDLEVRKASFSTDPISWKRHRDWFLSKLKNPKCLYWIGMLRGGIPIGQLRFNLQKQEARMSLSLGKTYRGKGYGTKIIRLSTQKLFGSYPVRQIHAYIKPNNSISIRAFRKAGFKENGPTIFRRHPALHFILERNSG